MDNKVLDDTVDSIKLIQQLFTFDIYMMIFDKNSRIYYKWPEEENIKNNIGEEYFDKYGNIEKVLKTGKIVRDKIYSVEYEVELECSIIPLIENKDVVGCIAVSYVPVSKKMLTAQQIALQSIYFLMFIFNFENNECFELYKAYKNSENVHIENFLNFKNTFKKNIHKDDCQIFCDFIEKNNIKKALEKNKSTFCEIRWIDKEKNERWIEVVISNAPKNNSIYENFVLMIRDIHKRKQEQINLIEELMNANELIRQKELCDELTGLYNRKGLKEYEKIVFEKAKRENLDLFVCILDLNGLKFINDTYGHLTGDSAIKKVGEFIKKNVPDDFVCVRLGGDEFLVFGATLESYLTLSKMMKKIDVNLKDYSIESNLPYMLEISYGYYYDRIDGNKNINNYIKVADEKMYEMKQKKKNFKIKSETMKIDLDVSYEKNRIIIADENAASRNILKSLFGKNTVIIETENGVETIETIKNEKDISLIILSISLPVLNGYELLAIIKKYEWIKKVPVILISSEKDEFYEEMVLEAGAIDLIHKPYNLSIVKHRIFNILQAYKNECQLKTIVFNQHYLKQ